jgi:Uncharacterized conserved protein
MCTNYKIIRLISVAAAFISSTAFTTHTFSNPSPSHPLLLPRNGRTATLNSDSHKLNLNSFTLGPFWTPSSSFNYPTTNLKSQRFQDDNGNGNDDDDEEETIRLKILSSRRQTIRSVLRNAETQRNYRIQNNLVPEIDPETGKPIQSDSKAALTLTAFVVAAGAVTLRVGGRAALVSAVGLDFANDNPDLKANMDQILNYASSMDQGLEVLAFVAAWTLVKVFCFDAGGVVLALSAGILFGGVLQGAFWSAFAATIGSSVAYGLAKVDSPFRKKALELLEEYPSLRGIERVVAEDGLKAVLTLRLAPVLPIPIGLYNYVYGVTNVPYLDFAGGIFLGSLKPYLLDSYLGVFGKEVIDGSVNQQGGDGLQDIILLAALGFSVLIGVFASELAGETWESVKQEIDEEEKRKKQEENPNQDDTEDGIVRKFLGFEFPDWVVGAQLALKAANQRMEVMIQTEYRAKVWNCTTEGGDDASPPLPKEQDPAEFPNSPEKMGVGQGFDSVAAICDGLVLSPALIKAYFKYADPLFKEEEENVMEEEKLMLTTEPTVTKGLDDSPPLLMVNSQMSPEVSEKDVQGTKENVNNDPSETAYLLTRERPVRSATKAFQKEQEELLKILGHLREKTEDRLKSLNEKLSA